jgi:hypothetical protein
MNLHAVSEKYYRLVTSNDPKNLNGDKFLTSNFGVNFWSSGSLSSEAQQTGETNRKVVKTRKWLPKWAESLWVRVPPSIQKFPALMACNGSSPCSQQPVTRPFPEPDQSSPHCPISDFFQTHFFSPNRLLRILFSPFAHVSRPKLCMHLSYPPYVTRAPPYSFLLHLIFLIVCCQSQWPRGLRRGSAAARCWGYGFESRQRHGCLLWVLCVVR